MCFGKNRNQNDPEQCRYPNPNNFCGGFALNAVLSDLAELEEFDDAMNVYCQIQTYQKEAVSIESVGYVFLHMSMMNGTFMSLPSGICAAFDRYNTGREIAVCYTPGFAGSRWCDLINEETIRLKDLKVNVVPMETESPDTDMWLYVLVLVNNCHWVAVRKSNEGFVCYDPKTGKAIMGDSMEIALIKSDYNPEQVSGLFICIR